MSLRYRIALTIFCLEALMVGVVLFSSMRHSLRMAQDQFAAADVMAVDLLSDLARIALLTDDFGEFQAFVDEAHVDSRLQSLVLSDTRGQVMAASDPTLIGGFDVESSDGANFGSIGSGTSLRTSMSLGARRGQILGPEVALFDDGLQFDREDGEGVRQHAVQLGMNGHLLGMLRLDFSDGVLVAAHAATLRYGLIVAVTGMLLIAIVSLMIGHLLTIRLTRLAHVADSVAQGDTAQRAKLKGTDEVARVGAAFDGMLDRLEQQLEDVTTTRDRLIPPTEAMCQGFALWDARDRLVLCNQQFREIHAGLAIDLSPGLSFAELARVESNGIAEFDQIGPAAWYQRRHAQHQQRMTDLTYQLSSGRWIHLDERATADGGVVAIYTDMSDAKAREQELFESEDRMRVVMNSVGEGIATVHEDGQLLHVNRAFADIFQRPAGTLLGQRIDELLLWPAAEGNASDKPVAITPEHLPTNERVELVGVRGSGLFPVELTLCRVEWRRGATFIATVRDVTEQKRAHAMIVHQATHDPLTRLPNRTLFEDRLEQALRTAERSGRMVAVMYLDLDRFKTINDSFGHGTGDELLVAVADRLQHAIRSCDTAARMGGDEFIFIFGDLARSDDTAKPARKILESLSAPFTLAGREVSVGASIGLSVYPHDGWDRATLQRNADAAMYRAKSRGGNCIELYDRSMSMRAAERVALELDLRRACRLSEFEIVYQPQISLQCGRLVGVEALLRWRNSERGLVPPDQFIPVAEESGMINELGAWVLDQVFRDVADWRRAGTEIPRIAVNISPRQLDEELPRLAKRLGAEHGFDLGRLEFELTETALLKEDVTALKTIEQVRALGIGLALDDFGTGYSSLSHLRNYPVQRLKIDRAFIGDITHSTTGAIMTEAIVTLARGLGIHVVAEGVETNEQLSLLRQMSCDEGQGFLFGEPMSHAAIAALQLDRAA